MPAAGAPVTLVGLVSTVLVARGNCVNTNWNPNWQSLVDNQTIQVYDPPLGICTTTNLSLNGGSGYTTGLVPTAPTAPFGDNDTSVADTAFVQQAVAVAAAKTPLSAFMKPMSPNLYPSSDVTTYPTLSQTYPASPAATAQYNFGTGSTINTPLRWSMFGGNNFVSTSSYATGGNQICGNVNVYSSMILEFYTDSPDFTLFLNVSVATPYDFRVWADNMPMTTNWQTGGASNMPSGANFIRTQFATTRVRKITFALQGGFQIGALISNNAKTNFWPTEKRFRCAIIGDSYIQGGFTDPIDNGPIAAANIPNQLSLHTGWEVFGMGEGGTGYLNGGTSPNAVYGDSTRMTALAALPALDLIIVWGTANDGASTVANVQAAQTSLYNALAAARPSTPIIVVGPENFPSAGGATAAILALDAGMQTAAQAHPQVRGYISELTPDQWITGTGTQPITNGNAGEFIESGAQHPSRAGASYLARRLVSELMKIKV